MNARTLAASVALTLTTIAAASAKAADDSNSLLAWQQPGYVMEVVIATGTHPAATADSSDTTLAWQEPGYVEDVVVVTASRKEALEALLRIERPVFPDRRAILGVPAR